MRNKLLAPNIDNSNPLIYPNGRIKDNTGSGNGTPVNEFVYGDLHEMKDKLMRLYGITPNDLPDNEVNGFQLVDALRALASKNDFILDLTTVAGVVNVGLKLGFILEKESVLCLSGFDFTTETQIRGIDGVSNTLTVVGSFKSGEYVRLIKTITGITLIREVDAVNLDLAVSEFNYLKKASQTEENAGTIDTKATTPLTNKTVFARRVNGVDSSTYLATVSQNGLLSAADKVIIDSIGASDLKNVGFISGIEVSGGSVGVIPSGGDISSASITNTGGGFTTIRCTMANTMASTTYDVTSSVISLGTIAADNTVGVPVIKIISTTQFDISIREFAAGTQNLRINFRIYQL